jgi:hypothetical protein
MLKISWTSRKTNDLTIIFNFSKASCFFYEIYREIILCGLWTISNRWRPFCCHGSHTELAYSRVGRRFITWFQIKYIGVLSIDAYSYSSNVFPHKMISLYIS